MFDPAIELNHWLVPGTRVQAGEYPGGKDLVTARAKLEALLAMGTDTIIDLTEPSEGLRDYEALMRSLPGGRFVDRLRAPIPDLGITDDARIHFVLDVIEAALDAHRRVYLHCWGGIGRTGMIAACLMVRRGMSPEEALRTVAESWKSVPKAKLAKHATRTSPETAEQMEVVRKWADKEAVRRQRRGETARVASMTANQDLRDTPERADLRRRVRGCLIGGAVGDALGLPVEFKSLEQIRKILGPNGVTELALDMNLGAAPISDDTQMTLFTAEGMLRGINRGNSRGVGGPSSCMTQAYLRWLVTQGETWSKESAFQRDLVLGWAAEKGPLLSTEPTDLHDFDARHAGWLVRVKRLHAQRAPGTTCLASLRAGGIPGSRVWANDRKGNGGVMRIAPVGLFPNAGDDTVFELGCEAAGITHGHPTGRLSAGVFALMILKLIHGRTIRMAVAIALERVQREPEHEETSAAITAALALFDAGAKPTPALIESLGGGWVAEEALAIAIYCALLGEAAESAEAALLLSVNHGGDSDSTGSMTGQLLGARFGEEVIPARWKAVVELRDVIGQIADDVVTEWRDDAEWWGRYPGY